MESQPVEIVRPHRDTAANLAVIVAKLIDMGITAWALMLLAPIATGAHWHPAFSQALAIVITARLLIPSPPLLDSWSRAGKKGKS